MFYQHNVYPATEYGTRECREDREPCGAFYGLPYSGEVKRHTADTFYQHMPSTYIPEAPIMDEYTRKRNAYYRAKALYMDLICEGWLQDLPRDEHKRYKELAKFYARGEEWAIDEMTDIYQRYLQRLNG